MKAVLFVLALLFCPFAVGEDTVSTYPIRIDRVKSARDIQFVATNDGPATLTLSFDLKEKDFRANRPLPVALVIAPGSSREIVRITPAKRWDLMRFNYKYHFLIGDISMPPDENHRYRLPFGKGTVAQIVQEPGGVLSTHNEQTRYAIDFGVPEGTLVTAARAGTVVDVKDTFTEGRPDPALEGRGNLVAVMHADHSVAYYLHLAPRRVLVRIGQTVHAGDAIAHSGNTGYSQGPHLHFDVRRVVAGEDGMVSHESVPVAFYRRGAEGGRILIREGERVKAD